MKSRCLLNILLSLLVFAPAMVSYAALQATLSRQAVGVGESFDLVIKQTGGGGGEPDMSPLQAEFNVVNTQRSQVIQISGGQQFKESVWTITLIPKRAGTLLVPAIKVGTASTAPLKVVVQESRAGAAGSATEDVFVQVAAEPAQPYVQQHVIYTIHLYRAVDVSKATIDEPKAQPGILRVEKLDDSTYTKQIDNRTYRVNELRYVLIPLQSGAIGVPATNFRGQYRQPRQQVVGPDGQMRITGGGMANIARRAEAVTLHVRPIPAAFPGGANWLPAKKLSISGGWAGNISKNEVGTPLTYVVSLQASGYLAHQIAVPPVAAPQGFRSYEESPTLNNAAGPDGFTGRYTRNTAFIPQQPGSYTMPQVEIPWWNTDTDSLEYARLAATNIEVIPSSAMTTPPAAVSPAVSAKPAETTTEPAAPVVVVEQGGIQWWWLLLTGIFLTAWLATSYMWWRERQQRQHSANELRAEQRMRVRTVQRNLESACLAGDVGNARIWLLRWGQLQFPHNQPDTIGELVQLLPQLQPPLDTMNKCLYRKRPEQWRGRDLWQVVSACPKPPPPKSSMLEPLHRVQ